jgi:hypothetical protein
MDIDTNEPSGPSWDYVVALDMQQLEQVARTNAALSAQCREIARAEGNAASKSTEVLQRALPVAETQLKEMKGAINEAVRALLSSKATSDTQLVQARRALQHAEAQAEQANSRYAALELTHRNKLDKAKEEIRTGSEEIKNENMRLIVENRKLQNAGGMTGTGKREKVFCFVLFFFVFLLTAACLV